MSEIERLWADKLWEAVPGLRDRIDPFDQELPYVAFGLFASYLRELLTQNPPDMTLIGPTLTFLAEMGESEDGAVQGLLAVGTLEGLIGNWQNVEWLRPRFTPRLRHLFDYTVLAWYGDPPLSWSHLDLNIPPDSDSLEQAFTRIRQATKS